MRPEQHARKDIDKQLSECGWVVQNRRDMNITAGLGVAVREVGLTTGDADYLLFVDGKAAGVLEAKSDDGSSLTTAETQSQQYLSGLSAQVPHYRLPLPFEYRSDGKTTHFTKTLKPDARSREVFSVLWLEELLRLVRQESPFCENLREMPKIETTGRWKVQVRAITNLKQSLEYPIQGDTCDTSAQLRLYAATKTRRSEPDSFQRFVAGNNNEIEAISVLYSGPHRDELPFSQRHNLTEVAMEESASMHGWPPRQTHCRPHNASGSGKKSQVVTMNDRNCRPRATGKQLKYRWPLACGFATKQMQWIAANTERIASRRMIKQGDFEFTPLIRLCSFGRSVTKISHQKVMVH